MTRNRHKRVDRAISNAIPELGIVRLRREGIPTLWVPSSLGLGCDQDKETERVGGPLPAATESGNYKTLEIADNIEQTFNYSLRNCT